MALGEQKQDTYTIEEYIERLQKARDSGGIDRGQYVLDVSPDGTMKLSKVKKQWVQKNDE